MTDYWELPGLESVYLEDSWILAFEEADDAIQFRVDFVLTETHPDFTSPKPGEQYCYRSGTMTFEHVVAVTWERSQATPSVDASGETDWGSFDEFRMDAGRYRIVADFGTVRFHAPPPKIGFDDADRLR